MSVLALILGDQLDPDYLGTLGLDLKNDTLLMVESHPASENPSSHIQRTTLFLSAMRHFAHDRRKEGWQVLYRDLRHQSAAGEIPEAIPDALAESGANRVVCIQPGSRGLQRRLEKVCASAGVSLHIEDDPHFLCSPETFREWASGRKSLVMEYFYREQRRRHNILVDADGKPAGGTWNFDKENRKSFRTAPEIRPRRKLRRDAITKEVLADINEILPNLPGSAGAAGNFNWPVTRKQALRLLEDFIEHHLASFGDFQDAMWTGEATLHHSLLAAALNLKLLNPREVLSEAVAAWESGAAPLNAVEGFVRQILGWREFIRGVYFFADADYAESNALQESGKLPEFYWDGDTEMSCMASALGHVHENAYGHHIERLMVTGNFAMMAGVEPRQVLDWYLGMYADAVEWVTTPNTIGMALHADGGLVGSKPYAASGRYIDRMSNHCAGCRYDPKARRGEEACPFTVFFWDFLDRHEANFRANPRMSMMLRNLDRIAADERDDIRETADRLRHQFGMQN